MNKAEIKKLLIDKNMTQTQMAKEIGMSRQYLWAIFSGHQKAWKYRRRIAQYLQLPEEILFPQDGDTQESCQ